MSVVIPTRDRRPHSIVAVRSALAQAGVDLEIVVVDDGSTNGTAERLAGLGDDDAWSPQYLRAQLDSARGAGATWAYGGRLHVSSECEPIHAVLALSPDAVDRSVTAGGGLAGPSMVIVRRDVLQRIGGFDERLAAAVDWDLWLRLAEAEPVAATGDLLVAYMLHAGNMHLADPRRLIAEYAVIERAYAARGARLGPLDLAPSLRWLAHEQARAGHRSAAAAIYARAARRSGSPADCARAARSLLDPRPRDGALGETCAGPGWLADLRTMLADERCRRPDPGGPA